MNLEKECCQSTNIVPFSFGQSNLAQNFLRALYPRMSMNMLEAKKQDRESQSNLIPGVIRLLVQWVITRRDSQY